MTHVRSAFPAMLGLIGVVATTLTPAAVAQEQTPAAQPAAAQPADAAHLLQIGDPAPPFKVASWVRGEPIASLEPKHVYVLLFFATHSRWTPDAMAKLEAVQKAQTDATVHSAAISLWERAVPAPNNDFAARVAEFAKEKGGSWPFPVAYDGDLGEMNSKWMHAADRRWIPSVFVVDRENKIAWIGHPLDERDRLEDVVAKVVAGTWDAKAAAAQARTDADVRTRTRQAVGDWDLARRAGDWEQVLRRWEEIAQGSKESGHQYLTETLSTVMIEHKQAAKGYEWLTKMADGPMNGDAAMLNSAAWFIVDQEGLTERDLPLALRLAQRACEASGHKAGHIEDTLARVYFDQGDLDKALETQRLAVSITPESDPQRRSLVTTLEKYERAKASPQPK